MQAESLLHRENETISANSYESARQAEMIHSDVPRAVPWAAMNEPFRLSQTNQPNATLVLFLFSSSSQFRFAGLEEFVRDGFRRGFLPSVI